MTDTLLNTLITESEKIMSEDKMYHDFAHARNVFLNAKILLKKLGGDEIVILTSSLFHDIARDQDNHEEMSANMLKVILNNIPEFPKEKIAETCLAVLHHEQDQVTHNGKILSDADKIDAFNDLGVGRGFMMAAKKGCTLKEAILLYLDLLEKWYKGFYFEESREMVKKNYDSTSRLLLNMLDMYK